MTTRIAKFLLYLFLSQAILFFILLVRNAGYSSDTSIIVETSLNQIRLPLNNSYNTTSQNLESTGAGSSKWQSRPDLVDLGEVEELNVTGIVGWENCTEEFIERFVPHCERLTRALDAKSGVTQTADDYCPCLPPSLVGQKPPLRSSSNLKSLEDEVELGSEWSPSDCRARQRVAIIIPYRDRKSHLNLLLSNLHPFLQRQKISYQIFVIEQDDPSSIFNKGLVMNSGFLEILRGLPQIGPHSTGDATPHTTQPLFTGGSENLINLFKKISGGWNFFSGSGFPPTTSKPPTPSPYSNSFNNTNTDWLYSGNTTDTSTPKVSDTSSSYVTASDTVIFDTSQVPDNNITTYTQVSNTVQHLTSNPDTQGSNNAQDQQNQHLSHSVESELGKKSHQYYTNSYKREGKNSTSNTEKSQSFNSANELYKAKGRKLLQTSDEGERGWAPFDCFIFHDVDMLPEDDRNIYTCTTVPRHVGAFVDKFKYKIWDLTGYNKNIHLLYPRIFGGVTAFTRKQFERVNGFSTEFYGWGGEDDDMRNRVDAKNLNVVRFPRCIAKYSMIKHKIDRGNPYNTASNKAWENRTSVYKQNGLNNLSYSVVQWKRFSLYTWILVSVPPAPKLAKTSSSKRHR